MGILLGSEIIKAVRAGDITITPFHERLVNPNSYNLRLGKRLVVYTEKVLDVKHCNEHKYIDIPDEGYVLEPGRLYLGETKERTQTDKYVPGIDGRSSMARLGLLVHLSAGFGDIGFTGNWTLEMVCLHPVKIYRNMEIAQIYFHTYEGGEVALYRSRKYQSNHGVQPSYSWMDF